MSFERADLRRLAGGVLLAGLVSFAAISGADTQPATSTSKKPLHHTVHHRKSHKTRIRGQKAIDGDRIRQIQQALIREHYMKGDPSGKWDASTQQAMKHYQADQGWQSKTIPDSRALIRLGLGPDNQHLLNPESAMTTAPVKRGSTSVNPATASAAPVSTTDAGPMPSTPVSTPSSGMASSPSR